MKDRQVLVHYSTVADMILPTGGMLLGILKDVINKRKSFDINNI
jgi:hypothetical protein